MAARAEREPATPQPVARLRSFNELMQRRVRRILLVSSLYDSFIMSEEGHVQETLLSQFIELNLGQTPDLVQVPDGAAALEQLVEGRGFDLVIASLNTREGNAAELARTLREADQDLPVIALAYSGRELQDFVGANDTSDLERIFLWQGDVRVLSAMVMYMEDRLNVENDTGLKGVPAIIVVEDNVRFYSSFLPTIYSEIFRHTHELLSKDLNPSQRMMRMRARTKVLLCDSYEEAWEYFERYAPQVLGVVSDFEFPRDGELAPTAGLDLCSRVREARPDIRLVMQSSRPENQAPAEEIGASFLLKGSPLLLNQLRKILVDRFGFGDFIFRMPDQREVDRASDLRSLGEKLRTVPAESVAYHAEHNHFSNWIKARTEFALAERFRPRKLDEFESPDHLRAHLLEMLDEFRRERQRSVIAEFDRARFEPEATITRIGTGSLGGKARGVAFANRILHASGFDERFPEVEIFMPPSVVLATGIFEEFLAYEGLRDFAIGSVPDELVLQRFLEAPFPRRGVSDLREFLLRVKYPLAVRSSSLLEDSLTQPFAGVYETCMLPNNDLELDTRWNQLASAVKRVYASAFTERAKAYLSMTSYRLEEEKMAVMIQELVGNQHQNRFYPDFAGVARSYNFYPEPGHAAEDGVVAVGLGMGQTVVGGHSCLRFNPRHPRQIVSFSSVKDALDSAQREFFALDLTRHRRESNLGGVQRHPIDVAEQDGPLAWLGSTYLPDDQRIVDGIGRSGVRLVTFAQVLKHGAFPLAEILRELLARCSEGTGGPVEIEFAGSVAGAGRPRGLFALLQMRPLAMSREREQVKIGDVSDAELVCRSTKVLGNGRIDDIRDLVIVDIESFERRKSSQVALQVARFDAILRKEGRPYLLVGVGRWGSSDPHLGIPVGWSQIAGARVIVEAGFKDFKVTPSQGTHFFQNLTSSNTGYLTVNPDSGDGYLDWEWLSRLEAVDATEYVRHARLERPLVVTLNGHLGQGIIRKPTS